MTLKTFELFKNLKWKQIYTTNTYKRQAFIYYQELNTKHKCAKKKNPDNNQYYQTHVNDARNNKQH